MQSDARRMLVDDDMPAIYEEFGEVLCPSTVTSVGEDAEVGLLASSSRRRVNDGFEIDSASHGREAYELLRRRARGPPAQEAIQHPRSARSRLVADEPVAVSSTGARQIGVRNLRRALVRPELHILLGLVSMAAFFWPLFALDRPDHVFCALFIAWGLSIGALFLVSRGCDDPADEQGTEPEGTQRGDEASDV